MTDFKSRPGVGRLARRAIVVAALLGALLVTDPAGAAERPIIGDAQVFVEPAADLVDRQSVTVRGIDFDPVSNTFGAAQCDATLVAALEIDGCDLSTAVLGSTDPAGTVQLELSIRRIITTPGGGEVDCAAPGACVIGAGTLDATGTAVIEGSAAPIVFDPEVPPAQPLSIDVEVDNVTADLVTATVSCNREATFGLSMSLVQTKGPNTAQATGFPNGDTTCDVTPAVWEVALTAGPRRFSGGPAALTVSGFAFDGFEAVNIEESTDVSLTGGPRDAALPADIDGEFTSISVIGGTADDGVEVEVVCDRPFEFASVSVQVTQWAGLDLISRQGFAALDGCDGTERVVVPFGGLGGVLVGGPANVVANLSAQTMVPPDGFLFDAASTSGVVTRSGRSEPGLFVPVPNPDSRITLDALTASSLTGTVDCDEPVRVSLFATAAKRHGRTLSAAFANAFVECEGPTPFVLDLSQPGGSLRGGGEVAVFVSGSALGIGPDGFPTFLWNDNQQATMRLTGN